jgi:hypothetical protein
MIDAPNDIVQQHMKEKCTILKSQNTQNNLQILCTKYICVEYLLGSIIVFVQ